MPMTLFYARIAQTQALPSSMVSLPLSCPVIHKHFLEVHVLCQALQIIAAKATHFFLGPPPLGLPHPCVVLHQGCVLSTPASPRKTAAPVPMLRPFPQPSCSPPPHPPRPIQVLSPSWHHLDYSRLHSLFPKLQQYRLLHTQRTEVCLVPCCLHCVHLISRVMLWLDCPPCDLCPPPTLILSYWVSQSRCLRERFWLNDQRSTTFEQIAGPSCHTTNTQSSQPPFLSRSSFNTKNNALPCHEWEQSPKP